MAQNLYGEIKWVAGSRTPPSFPAVSTNTSTCLINKPTSVKGDLLIAIIDAGGVTTTPPAGWTLLDSYATVGGQSMLNEVYYRYDGGSEPSSWTWTDSSGGLTPLMGQISNYRGVDPNNPFGAMALSESTTTNGVDTPSITITEPGTLTLHIARLKATFTSGTTPAEPTASATGPTRRQRWSNRGGTTEYSAELWDSASLGMKTGATSAVTFTWTLGATGSPVVAGGIYRQIQLNANMLPARSTNMQMPLMRGSFL